MAMTRSAPVGFDNTRPHPARIYDYLLGGVNNFAADRAAADALIRADPDIIPIAKANRRFLMRAIRYLAKDAGIRQFIDIGAGYPTPDNVHHVAQATVPDARVVYVDIDPVVVAHIRAMLADQPTITAIIGDVRRPKELLSDSQLREVIDLGEPVAILLAGVMHFIREEDGDTDPYEIVAHLREKVAPGSYLAISHGVLGAHPQLFETAQQIFGAADIPLEPRSPEAITKLFGDFELVPPGLSRTTLVRRLADGTSMMHSSGVYAGIGRKPA